MIAWLVGFLAKSVLMQSPIGGFIKGVGALLKRVPRKVWYVLAIAGAVYVAYLTHQHYAHKALKMARDAGYAQGVSDTDAVYTAAQKLADAQAERINSKVRKKADEQARRIDRAADDLQLRGPGKAVCPGVAAPPRATGGHQPPGRPADAQVDRVPDRGGPELIALPFADAIGFAKQCDLNRSEALSWREADDLQRANSVSLESHAISTEAKPGGH